jgi:hypothetical protein
MKIKTSELTGHALDWAVAKCEGVTDEWREDGPFLWNGVPCIRSGGHDVNYRPSTEWWLGGPIIERERITLSCWSIHSTPWKASIEGDTDAGVDLYVEHGPTPLIAAMRCYVASKMGDDIEVPKELT